MKKERFKNIALKAAMEAGRYIKKSVGKIKSIRYKGEINVVTDIDKRAEKIIVDTIKNKCPGHDFLAEENSYKSTGSDYRWIIDPLDGTTNFLHKFPFFCVSIGLEYRNDLIIGVVYDPEKGELFHAESGKGAFLNRKRIYVSEVTSVKKALLATGFAYNLKQARNKNINNFIKLLKASQAIRRAGSAALDLCYVACGRFDGFWELNLNPWDTAAGVVILKEAQGRVSALNGKKFNLYGKELLSSNSKIHNQLVRILSE